MVLTGADVWTMKDDSPHPTGFWMEEFVKPHKTFSEAGFDVSIAMPHGRAPTVDPLSLALQFNHDDQGPASRETLRGCSRIACVWLERSITPSRHGLRIQ